MVVISIFVVAQSERFVECHTCLFPVLKPLHLFAGSYKELHFHLLKLTHTEDKLTGHNLIAEGFPYLGNPEGELHTPCFLHIEVVNKDPLSRLRAQIDF